MGGTLGLADLAGEAVLLAGGGRAILMQIAHPAVGAGVAAHSGFARDPLARLRGTLTFSYAEVYGTDADRRAVRRTVNRAHGPVRGPGYSAFDPELQLWVFATLYDSTVTVWEQLFGPLDAASAERLYADFGSTVGGLQMPTDLWPADRAAFAAYWADASAGLVVTDDTRRVAAQLLYPASAPRWMRALMPTARLATAGFLPAELRSAYGMPWSGIRSLRFDALLAATRATYPRLPRRLRFWPRDVLLRELRATRSLPESGASAAS
ncbi:oxygenase MpaB family protein [Gryllotalpicola koreensis]|uniref:Oxygenase MpaB family protein n=1 Tax=Gryllotalpicola koreensis TaxID=993086 RepID=A0ABP8A420_9MICO